MDFDEIFSPLVKMTTLKCIPGLVAIENMELIQMDVKATFFAWGSTWGDIHGVAGRLCGKRQITFGLQDEKESPWT